MGPNPSAAVRPVRRGAALRTVVRPTRPVEKSRGVSPGRSGAQAGPRHAGEPRGRQDPLLEAEASAGISRRGLTVSNETGGTTEESVRRRESAGHVGVVSACRSGSLASEASSYRPSDEAAAEGLEGSCPRLDTRRRCTTYRDHATDAHRSWTTDTRERGGELQQPVEQRARNCGEPDRTATDVIGP
jgi:hypothetical protein